MSLEQRRHAVHPRDGGGQEALQYLVFEVSELVVYVVCDQQLSAVAARCRVV